MAVSISAGTDAITSAFPILHEHNVFIAVMLVIFITILNLRGLTESAAVLAYPIYLFVFALVMLIFVGMFKIATGQVSPQLHTSIGTPGSRNIFIPITTRLFIRLLSFDWCRSDFECCPKF